MMSDEVHNISEEKPELVSRSAIFLHRAVDNEIHGSVIVPVNAAADLCTVLSLLGDLKQYNGHYNLEVILVINNYSPTSPPTAIEEFRQAGLVIIAEPDLRRQGEVVIVSARAAGVRAAKSNITIHFDADCRIPNPTALLNWYLGVLRNRTELAYSHVSFYDLRPMRSIQTKIALHHIVRFIKRKLFRIPTTRGSNYAIHRQRFLDLYEARKISVDLQVGPAVKLTGAKIAYSGRKELSVFTSGRRFKGGWRKLIPYFRNRLSYNIRSISILRKGHPEQTWKGFDLENENRGLMGLGQQSSEEGLGKMVLKNVSKGKR